MFVLLLLFISGCISSRTLEFRYEKDLDPNKVKLIEKNKEEELRESISNLSAEEINSTDANTGLTLLHVSSREGKTIVEMLIEKGADI